MSNEFDAIVIGSGCGGSGVAALLSHAGKKVLVLEKNKNLGGRNITYYKDAEDGITMDMGWHFFVLANKGPIGQICEAVGRPDAINWVHTTTSLLQIGDEPKRYSRRTMFEAIAEESRPDFERLFNDVMTMSDDELHDLWHTTVDDWLARYTDEPMACCLIRSFTNQYLCVRTEVASAAEFILDFRENMVNHSSGYPIGGNAAVTNAYLDAAREDGATVMAGAGVKSIIIEDGRAVGVETEAGDKFYAPVVISNADIKTTVAQLVGEEHFPADYAKRIAGLTYANHSCMHRVILSEKVTDKTVVIYIPDENGAPFEPTDEMLEGKVPALVGGCYTVPSNFDPSMCPEGKQIITSAHGCPPDISANLEEWKKSLYDSFLKVFPEAEGKVEKVWIDAPSLIKEEVGENGCIIGVGQTVDQVRSKRPSIKSPIPGLYFCSADTGSHGIGTELASRAALETFEILKGEQFV